MSLFQAVCAGVLAVAALAAIFAYVHHRRSMLPPHLKPYFKNQAALDASVEEFRATQEERRKELTEPCNVQEAAEYLMLNDFHVASTTYQHALEMVESGLEANPSKYGQQLGEIFCFSRAYQNDEKAYYYYFIGYSQDGYSVGWLNQNPDSHLYYGPNGDFRHESQVSALVDELGFDKVKQLDSKARAWLTQHKLDVVEVHEEQEPQVD